MIRSKLCIPYHMHPWLEYCVSGDKSFSALSGGSCCLSVPIDDACFDYQDNWFLVFQLVSHLLATLKSSVWEDSLRLQISYLSNSLPRFSISWWFLLKVLFSMVIENGNFFNTTLLATSTSCHSDPSTVYIFLLLYLPTCLLAVWTWGFLLFTG